LSAFEHSCTVYRDASAGSDYVYLSFDLKGEPMLPTLSARWLSIAVAVGALCCSSCGGGKDYYPVRGRVLVNGKPAEGITVVLTPQGDHNPAPEQPAGGTRADGSFELRTYVAKDRASYAGAPAGTYVVTCVWYPPDMGSQPGLMTALPDKLGGKYANPATSPLRVTIPPHAVELPPFELEANVR
jgi:hypothetical protein